MENCRDSIKATAKRGKILIKKGADPERTMRNAYDKICDYMEILDRMIHIQPRALASQSKSLLHMIQRDLYIMVNAGLIRRDAEMTNLQGSSRGAYLHR